MQGAVWYPYANGTPFTEPILDHDRFDVHRRSIGNAARSFAIAKQLYGFHRHIRDHWLRTARSISQSVAEGNGRRSFKDRNRFLDIARGSVLQYASIHDVLAAITGVDGGSPSERKGILKRIVSRLTRLIGRADVVSELSEGFNAAGEYEYGDVEYKYEQEEQAEQPRAPELVLRPLWDGPSTFPVRLRVTLQKRRTFKRR